MDRRAFLRHFAIASAALCPVCSALSRPAFAEEHGAAHPPHWGYDGEHGPAHWNQLSPDYAACGAGREQSPINLDQPVGALVKPPEIHWQPMPLDILNNGHTIQVNCAKGSSMMLDGISYDLVQYHFHHPSEHHIAGTSFDMELHFVHRAADGSSLAVLGVMIAKGEADSALETIWRSMPEKSGQNVAVDTALQPSALLPKDSTTYRYAGSLTTPPCSEIVSWVVFRQPITASAEQIAKFARLFPMNARPPQPLNRRKLLLDFL